VGDREDIDAEHDQLRREVDALRKAHAALGQKPVDTKDTLAVFAPSALRADHASIATHSLQSPGLLKK
jgi:hypothetical protein